MMNGYPYPPRSYSQANTGPMMMGIEHDAMAGFDIHDGQSLDSMVAQNDKDNRRRSMPPFARGQQQLNLGSPDTRRLSMMNFGDPNGGDMEDFRFDMSSAAMGNLMHNNTPAFPRSTASMQNDQLPASDLSIANQFQGQTSPYPQMTAPGSAYASPMHQKTPLDMEMSSYQNGINMSLDMNDSLNMMPSDMNIFPGNQFNSPLLGSPLNQDFAGPMTAASQDNTSSNNTPSTQAQDHFKHSTVNNTPEVKSGRSGYLSRALSQDQASMRAASRPQSDRHSSNSVPTRMTLASLRNQQPIAQDPAQDLPKEVLNKQLREANTSWPTPPGGFPSTMHHNPHMKTQFKNAYSSTGFDMLGVLVSSLTRR
jgi:hypothetical protein